MSGARIVETMMAGDARPVGRRSIMSGETQLYWTQANDPGD